MTFTIKGNGVYLGDRKLGWITRLVNGRRIYVSPRKRREHYVRIFQGWGITESFFRFLKDEGVDDIHISLLNGTIKLMASLSVWESHGIPSQLGDFEKQIFLPEEHMVMLRLSLPELLDRRG